MPSLSSTLLQRYRYTCLDQLASGEGAGQLAVQRFYQQGHLASEVQGQNAWAVLQVGEWLLAQRNQPSGTSSLLATDAQRSVSHVLGPTLGQARYTPYGHTPAVGAAPCLLGFTGERAEPITGHYLLGSYRAFNPLLMRFNSPDSFSPFGSGGLNPYAYCAGDPVNRRDPSGHSFWSAILKGLGRAGKSSAARASLQAEMKKSAEFLSAFTKQVAETSAETSLLKNFKAYSSTIDTFDKAMPGGNLELNIMAHGLPGYIEDGVSMKKAADFVKEFTARPGLISPDTKRLRLMTCYGADRGKDGSLPLGQQLHDATGIPVIAYEGVLTYKADLSPNLRIPYNIVPYEQGRNYKPVIFTLPSKNREMRNA